MSSIKFVFQLKPDCDAAEYLDDSKIPRFAFAIFHAKYENNIPHMKTNRARWRHCIKAWDLRSFDLFTGFVLTKAQECLTLAFKREMKTPYNPKKVEIVNITYANDDGISYILTKDTYLDFQSMGKKTVTIQDGV